jgi:hypothetical protein
MGPIRALFCHAASHPHAPLRVPLTSQKPRNMKFKGSMARFRLAQPRQAVTQLSKVWLPPRLSGMTWFAVNSSTAVKQ